MQVAVIMLLLGLMPGFVEAQQGQGKAASNGDKTDSLIGNWNLSITLQDAAVQSVETPQIVTILEVGSKLLVKVTVPNVTPTATSLQTQGVRELVFTDLKYNGKDLSFTVGDEDNLLIAELSRINDDEFAGRWRSPLGARWRGKRSEFSGTLTLVRKK